MKRYRKPIIRWITSEADTDLLADSNPYTKAIKNTVIESNGEAYTDDYSKGNDGWDAWDED